MPSSLTPFKASALYLAAALAFTWPLALGLGRDIPWDLGDPLLNAWILAWDAHRLQRVLTGDFSAVKGFWNANIFYPEPLALAYSEHLFAQAVQILPVYSVTGNIILSYNLLFLSTFVFSGLGAYLFVREVTGSARAGVVAGLVYAFAPYRVPQFSHVQVISSQWMPLTLYGFRRFFHVYQAGVTPWRTYRPLIGAGVALLAQNLSNGYYLLYFSPFVAAYVVFEMATRGLLRDVRVWRAVAATGALVTLLTLPFLVPYLELRRLGMPPRPLAEVAAYSADVFSYWTAPPESHAWGRTMRAFPKSEGDLFPTLTAIALGAIGLAASANAARRRSRLAPTTNPWVTRVVYLLYAVCALYAALIVLLLTGTRFSLGLVPISVKGIGRPVLVLTIAGALLIFLSPRIRRFASEWTGTVAGFAALAVVASFILSLGPEIRTSGRLIGETGPYSLLYHHVPGFDGLRVPARYAMLLMLFLAIVSGTGAAAVERRFRRGAAIVLIAGVLAVAESFAAPIIINGTEPEGGYAPLPPRVYTGDGIPRVYHFLKTLPSPGTAIIEFPFGEWGYELRYMFYSTNHWHPLLNGYSGAFPLSYSRRGVLRHPLDVPDYAWKVLSEDAATHAVVHEGLYKNGDGTRVSRWLEDHGASLVAEYEGDKVFALRSTRVSRH